MKKMTALLICALAAGTLSAAPAFRMDVVGMEKDSKVKITPAKAEGDTVKTQVASWRAEADRPYNLTTSGGQVTGSDWVTQSGTFKAEESGKIAIQLCGQWAKEAKDREWLLISDVKVNGEPAVNGDFAKSGKRGDQVMPDGFWVASKAEFLPGAGPEGKGAVKANHDNRLITWLQVEAGKTYTVSVQVKAAE